MLRLMHFFTGSHRLFPMTANETAIFCQCHCGKWTKVKTC